MLFETQICSSETDIVRNKLSITHFTSLYIQFCPKKPQENTVFELN